MSLRIKGQEISLLLIINGVVAQTVTNIKSANVNFQTEVLKEGYLGQTTDQRDSIFHGISGDLEIHNDNSGIFGVVAAIVDKARRRTPGTVINVQMRFAYPNGQRALVIIPDVEFGEIPISIGSRSDYVSFKLPFEAAEAQVIA